MSNTKAWMTCDIFSQWLKTLDKQMRKRQKQILMFIDNCTAHGDIPDMTNIKIKYLPPNTTSKLEPLDQGIIQCFKMHYRKEVVRQFLADIEHQTPTNIDVLQAMWMITKAWNQVTERTVRNCFRKTGFKALSEDEDDNLPLAELSKSLQSLSQKMNVPETEFEDYVTFDNDLAVCGKLTDCDIVESVLPDPNEEAEEAEEGEEEKSEDYTIRDARKALNIIKSVFVKKGDLSDDLIKSITDLDCALDHIKVTGTRQTTLDMYF